MRKVPPLTAVRVFEAAARHENFTTAAAELGMTQAAVSYQIRLLEERLGVPLFARAKRRVTLTDAGRRAAPMVSGAFDTLSDAFSEIVAENEAVLTISASQTFASNWMAPRLGAFQLARPELAVRLQTENRLIDFASEEVDVGIRTGTKPWPGLQRHFLFRLTATPMCSPAYRDAHGIAAPQDLLRVTQLNPQDEWWKAWFAAAGVSEEEVRRQPGIRLDSQAMEGSTALAGHGVGMLSPLYWQAEIAAGRLVQLFPLMMEGGPCFWLVYPEHKRNQTKIRAFREWLLSEVERVENRGSPDSEH